MRHLKFAHAFVATGMLILSFIAISTLSARSASADTYNGGELIDNPILLKANSMGTGQTGINNIQSFLSSKGSFLASYNSLFDCSVTILSNQQTVDAYKQAGAPCGQTVSAATIIYYASQVYGINPQVALATMQKEQSIITAPTFDQYKVNYAMGYGCPDSGGCSATPNSNFLYQMDNGTGWLRINYERALGNMTYWFTSASWTCGTSHLYYSPSLYPGQNVQFGDDNGVPYANYTITNAATSSLYCYTPHAYNNFPGCTNGTYASYLPTVGSKGMCYTGSYNFVKYFNLWFGSTFAFTSNGINYSAVFDPEYYLANNTDLTNLWGNDSTNPTVQLAAFNHFLNYGMIEGRQASANFSVQTYRNRYSDLRWAFGTNLKDYYIHFLTNGQPEGRSATGTAALQPVTSYGGVDYSSVYDFSTYLADNSDLKSIFSNDDTGALLHFINYGMAEGRAANANFSVQSYQAHYYDLRRAFGNNLKAYYLHYLYYGKAEGRVATGTYLGGTSALNGVDYSAVYNFNDYETENPDIQKAFGLNDIAALQHFVTYGMNEGRQASSSFNVFAYKARYPDLQAAFGNNLKAYYLHYLYYGKAEGRVGN